MSTIRLVTPRLHEKPDGCGRLITELRKPRFFSDPDGMGDLWYHDCQCGSTLVAQPEEVIVEPEQESRAA